MSIQDCSRFIPSTTVRQAAAVYTRRAMNGGVLSWTKTPARVWPAPFHDGVAGLCILRAGGSHADHTREIRGGLQTHWRAAPVHEHLLRTQVILYFGPMTRGPACPATPCAHVSTCRRTHRRSHPVHPGGQRLRRNGAKLKLALREK